MPGRKPDKLDLKITEIEAGVVTEIHRLMVQECLGRCKIHRPDCPHLNFTKICPSIQKALETEVPHILREMSKKRQSIRLRR